MHQIVEIGAGYTPVAPKSDGWRTHTVDHASQPELRLKYCGQDAASHLATIDVNIIEHVDTIWRDRFLHEVVPADLLGRVDLIIASHVLEHLPDLVGFFASASRLCRPQGCISAAFPDRRYCFDCYKPWSTTGDLLDAHHRGLTRHSLKTAFNHMAYSASANGQLGWGPGPIDRPMLMDPFKTAAAVADTFRDDLDCPYQDYHAWQFTPAGFRLAMLEMAAMGITDWHLESLEEPGTFEFFVLLRRDATNVMEPTELQRLRQELLVRQLVEAREQIDFMLGRNTGSKLRPDPADDSYQDVRALVAAVDTASAIDIRPPNRATEPAHLMRAIWQKIRGC